MTNTDRINALDDIADALLDAPNDDIDRIIRAMTALDPNCPIAAHLRFRLCRP